VSANSKFAVVGMYAFAVAIAWSSSHLAGIFMLIVGLSFVRTLHGKIGRR